ncbi:MAG: twin-arginine translocation signal domain-containing protein [Bacteroidia bacterium]|nr:twin-arginine translocation signal domain-containing protein [Bacteroidia bacterium]
MENNRRDFLKKGALLGLASVTGALFGKDKLENIQSVTEQLAAEGTTFKLPDLPYSYDALEPFIDRQTMEIHFTKHHKAYVDKLNGADLSSLNLKISDAEKCRTITEKSPAIIRNNLGGHFNHCFFWENMRPNQEGGTNLPSGKLLESITATFKSFEDFKKEFSDKALKLFGSGWCWLIIDQNKKLKIITTPNQDNPLMPVATEKGAPILALDVWEHAYYLKYQNKRVEYISNWWNLVNWQKAEELFAK